MDTFKLLKSKIAILPQNNIDTDQIIPARFLKTTQKTGLGLFAFADWRYLSDGQLNPDFVFNTEQGKKAAILVAGDNFGCGSSREHAPWALMDMGLRVVISTSIADIFNNNALRNGLLVLSVNREFCDLLLKNPFGEVTVDLENQYVQTEQGEKSNFEIEPFAKYCMLHGFDQLDYLLNQQEAIKLFEEYYI